MHRNATTKSNPEIMIVNLLPSQCRRINDTQQPNIEPDGSVARIQDIMSSDRGSPSSIVTR